MVDAVEGFRQVDRGGHGAQRAVTILPLIYTLSDLRGEREKGGDAGAVRGETVLRGVAGEVREKERADETFEDFRGWAKEGNGTVRGAEMGRFTWFKDGKDKGMFPDSGKVSVGNRKVEEGGKIGDSKGAKVFEVEVSEAVRTKRRGAL